LVSGPLHVPVNPLSQYSFFSKLGHCTYLFSDIQVGEIGQLVSGLLHVPLNPFSSIPSFYIIFVLEQKTILSKLLSCTLLE
jgi:hypothetical protein